MIFYLLLAMAGIGVLVMVSTPILAVFEDIEPVAVFFIGLIFSAIFMAPVTGVWTSYASDLSKVCAQQPRIDVYGDRIASLADRLDSFQYPEKPEISLDADSPWASMVQSLTEAEGQLAKAKDERAVALRDIDKWKRGPFSGVVWFVGGECDSSGVI